MEATRTLFSLDSLYGEDLEIENPIGTIISDRDTWEVHKDGLGFRTKFYKILGYHIDGCYLIQELQYLGMEWTQVPEKRLQEEANKDGISRDELVKNYR